MMRKVLRSATDQEVPLLQTLTDELRLAEQVFVQAQNQVVVARRNISRTILLMGFPETAMLDLGTYEFYTEAEPAKNNTRPMRASTRKR